MSPQGIQKWFDKCRRNKWHYLLEKLGVLMDIIFSTREIATVIWLIIFIIFIFASPKIRSSAFGVIKAACTPKLSIPFILMLTYASLLVSALSSMEFWKWQYIKDILIWVLFAGVPLCYKAIGESAGENYFSNMILDNLKLVVLVEFIISSFNFKLIVEIILLPIITLLVLLDAVADTEPEYAPAKKFISFLMILGGMVFIGFTIAEAVNSYQTLGIIDSMVSFFIPIVFSVMYVPVAYGFAVYAKYELLFIHISFKESKDKKIKRKHRMEIFKVCGLSIKKILKFQKAYAMRMYVSMTQEEFDGLIKQFRTDL